MTNIDDILDSINKRPVIILSSPRTGSTILAMSIISYFKNKGINLEFCNEVGINKTEGQAKQELSLEEFSNFRIHNKNFVFKIHLFDMFKYYPKDLVDSILNDGNSFFIRIRRRNFVEQLASHHLARSRGIYIYNKDSVKNFQDTTHTIDKFALERQTKFLKNCNKVLSEYDLNYDLDLYYEDMIFPKVEDYVVTPKPENYNVLCDLIRDLNSELEV